MAQTRGERLATALNDLVGDSSDINGATIVGQDGLFYSANVPQRNLDEEMVDVVSPSIFGLANRSASQLQRGDLIRTLVQGAEGNIIVASINTETGPGCIDLSRCQPRHGLHGTTFYETNAG